LGWTSFLPNGGRLYFDVGNDWSLEVKVGDGLHFGGFLLIAEGNSKV